MQISQQIRIISNPIGYNDFYDNAKKYTNYALTSLWFKFCHYRAINKKLNA